MALQRNWAYVLTYRKQPTQTDSYDYFIVWKWYSCLDLQPSFLSIYGRRDLSLTRQTFWKLSLDKSTQPFSFSKPITQSFALTRSFKTLFLRAFAPDPCHVGGMMFFYVQKAVLCGCTDKIQLIPFASGVWKNRTLVVGIFPTPPETVKSCCCCCGGIIIII